MTALKSRKKRATCHPGKVDKGRGLCGACYDKVLKRENRAYAKRQIENTARWKSANRERTRELDRKSRNRPGVQRNKTLAKYGISEADYQRRHEVQGGKCLLCRRPPPKGKRLVVDHDHATGKVRGLLCKRCNTGLGFFHDSPSLAIRMALYLLPESSFYGDGPSILSTLDVPPEIPPLHPGRTWERLQ